MTADPDSAATLAQPEHLRKLAGHLDSIGEKHCAEALRSAAEALGARRKNKSDLKNVRELYLQSAAQVLDWVEKARNFESRVDTLSKQLAEVTRLHTECITVCTDPRVNHLTQKILAERHASRVGQKDEEP